MGSPGPQAGRTPWWMTAVIIAAMAPALLLPLCCPSGSPAAQALGTLRLFYPAYVLAAGLCAWLAYPRRKALAWILVALLLMSHAAIWALTAAEP